MKTHECMAKIEIMKYLAHGYKLQTAVKQAKANTLHRLDHAIDRVSDDLEWWNELHEGAVNKIQSIEGDGYFRPSDITDRPEVIRDLLSVGVIQCEAGDSHANKNNKVYLYRKSLNYLEQKTA